MKVGRVFLTPVVAAVFSSFLFLNLYIPAARADLVSTDALLRVERAQQQRAAVASALERADVRDALLAYGADPAQVQSRVDSLSDEEVQTLADDISQLPAGASSDPLGILLFVFVLLLITDIMGLTNVFPFVKKQR